jgi:hypothetical protein
MYELNEMQAQLVLGYSGLLLCFLQAAGCASRLAAALCSWSVAVALCCPAEGYWSPDLWEHPTCSNMLTAHKTFAGLL